MPKSEPLWTKEFRLLCAAQMIMLMAYFGSMTILPLFFVDAVHLDGMAMGIVTALFVSASIVTRPLSGYLLDTFGRKLVYVPSFFLFGICFLSYPFATSVALLVLLRILHGAVWGSLMSAANTVAVDLIPPSRRGEGISMFGLTFNLGQALGPAVTVSLIGALSYDWLFFSSGTLILAAALMVTHLKEPDVTLEKKPFEIKNLLEKSSLPTSLVVLLYCFPLGVMINYSVLYSAKELHAPTGAFFLFMAAGMGGARLLSGKTFDRSGPAGAMALAFCFTSCGLLLKMLTRDVALFHLSGLLMGVGTGIFMPVCQAMINTIAPERRKGAANATMMTAFDCGFGLGILIAGYVQKSFGWSVSHSIELIFVLLAALTFWKFGLPHYRAMRSGKTGTNPSGGPHAADL